MNRHSALVVLAVCLTPLGLSAQVRAPAPPTNVRIVAGTGGGAPLLSVNPASVNFGSVSTGSTKILPVTLTNAGASNITILNVGTSGTAFTASGVANGQTLTPAQTATLNVTFAPAAIASATGTVTITSTAGNSPNAISLTGAGSQPGPVTAFPGAEGGGALAVGGRGGVVFLVTNINDSGAGSLRACVNAQGPRTCVFRTGGTIALSSSLTVANPFITIAGQTAPGGGIQIRGPSGAGAPGNPALVVRTHDVVIQYLRIRRGHNAGEVCNQNPWSCGMSTQIIANQVSDNPYNIVFDHLDAQWSNYDALAVVGHPTAGANQPRSITVSYSILGEAFAAAGQTTGAVVGGYSGLGSAAQDLEVDIDFHHNLFAGTSHRMPLTMHKSGRLVNNIVYAWTYYPMRSKGSRDIIGNYFKFRSAQGFVSHEIQAWTTNDGNDTSFPPSFYLTGNAGPSDPSGTNNWAMTGLSSNQSSGEASSPLATTYRRNSPLPAVSGYVAIAADPVSLISSPSGLMLNTNRVAPYEGVGASRQLDCSGAWVDARDSVDRRIINAVVNGTTLFGSYDYSSLSASPQTQADLGGWPVVATGTACGDSNSNGLPDVWESYWAAIFGLGSTLNATGTNFGDGYTNLDHYISGLSPSK
jgi:pectate lyase